MSDSCLFLSTETADIESALIRRFTLCDWSHCGWYRLADGWTFSAMNDGKGVAWRPPNPTARILLLDVPRCDESLALALREEGKPYDVREIFGFIADQNAITSDAWICDRLLFQMNINLVPSQPLVNHTFIPIEHLTPRDVLISQIITERAA